MQGESKVKSKEKDRIRVFNGRTFLVHYRHLQAERAKISGCALCNGNMGAIFEDVETKASKRAVVESTGGDQEGATPSPHSGTEYWAEELPS